MSSNELSIRTEKGEYVGGDMIYGVVYLRIVEHVPSRSLKLILRGYEICDFEYTYVEEQEEDLFTAKTGKRSCKKDILRTEIKLIEYPGGFPEGCFAYAFQYQLPHNIPGVFHARHEGDDGRGWEAIIKYTIGAMLEIPNARPEERLSCEAPLVIYNSLDCRNVQMVPSPEKASGTVKTFFCIQRGSVHVTSKLERSAYEPTEKVNMLVEMRNEAAVEITGVTVSLIRVIKLHGMDRTKGEEEMSAHTIYDTVLETIHEGCNKNSTRTMKVELDLGSLEDSQEIGFPPNTTGTMIKCHYVIDVSVHVPWAPDIEVRQPLVINPPSNVVWKEWWPAAWVPSCVQAAVSGSNAVPPDILISQFSAMPAFQPLL